MLRVTQMGLKKAHKILVFKVNVKYHFRGLNLDVMMNIKIDTNRIACRNVNLIRLILKLWTDGGLL